jgi:hypothetical protein
MTPAEIALIVLLSEGDVPGQYKVCVNDECVSYIGTDQPYAYEYKGGIRVVTPGLAWKADAGGRYNCRDYSGSGQQITDSGHVINRICGYDDGFSLFFMEA